MKGYSDEEVIKWLRQSCKEQGIDLNISDELILSSVAILISRTSD